MIIDKRINEKVEVDVLTAKKILESEDYVVLSNEELDLIEEKLESKMIEELESKDYVVLSNEELDLIEEKLESKMIEELESKDYVVLSNEELESIESVLKLAGLTEEKIEEVFSEILEKEDEDEEEDDIEDTEDDVEDKEKNEDLAIVEKVLDGVLIDSKKINEEAKELASFIDKII